MINRLKFTLIILVLIYSITGCVKNSNLNPPKPGPTAGTTEIPEEKIIDYDPSDPISQLGSDNYYIASYGEKQIIEEKSVGVKRLTEELKNNENPQIREACARILGTMVEDNNALINLLKAAEKEKEEKVKYEIVSSIGKFKDKASIDLMAKILTEDNSLKIKQEAAYILGEIEEEDSVPPLIEAVNDKEPEVRAQAALSLGKLEDKNAVDSLILLMENDENENVRTSAARALGEIKSTDSMGSLITSMETDSSPLVRKNAAYALAFAGDYRAIDPLIRALENEEEPEVRASIACTLGMLNNYRAIDGLIRALNDENPLVKEQAAYAIGSIKDYEIYKAVESLEKALEDPSPKVRAGAAYALGEIKDRDSLEALKEALYKEKEDTVTETINKAIKKFR